MNLTSEIVSISRKNNFYQSSEKPSEVVSRLKNENCNNIEEKVLKRETQSKGPVLNQSS